MKNIYILTQVDKEGANPERAKQEISEAGLLPEEWGGDTPMIEASPFDRSQTTTLCISEIEHSASAA